MAFQISSSAFQPGAPIPKKYTCSGENISPPLVWANAPDGTRFFALIVDDPDAPAGTWVHWVLFNIPLQNNGVNENASGSGTEGVNDFRRTGYGGPCPPPGKPHRYFFKVYALNAHLDLPRGATKSEVETAMRNAVLAKAELVGTFAR